MRLWIATRKALSELLSGRRQPRRRISADLGGEGVGACCAAWLSGRGVVSGAGSRPQAASCLGIDCFWRTVSRIETMNERVAYTIQKKVRT